MGDFDCPARNLFVVRPMDSDRFDRDVVHSPVFFTDRGSEGRLRRKKQPEKLEFHSLVASGISVIYYMHLLL